VPYLQIDLPAPASAEAKAAFARRLAALYAEAMETGSHIPSIAFRELGAGNLIRLQDGELRAVLVVMCDIRRGRPPGQREALARAIAHEAAAAFAIDAHQVVVEFTQHTPDEMFRYGAIAPEWSPNEVQKTGTINRDG
jgi:phenylpyruvate tautomerase PptA (4-oxalocrotonate tautomerase family)